MNISIVPNAFNYSIIINELSFLTCSADQTLGTPSFPSTKYPRNPGTALLLDERLSLRIATLEDTRSEYPLLLYQSPVSYNAASIVYLARMLSLEISRE